jgi:hypothetical protein
MSEYVAFAENALSIYGWYILLALGTIIFLYFMAPYVSSVIYVQKKLKKVRTFLTIKLGPKAGQIIDVWIEGLDAIKDGVFTEEEMVREFIKIIKLRAASVDLTGEDDKALEEAAQMTIQTIAGNNKNKTAFKILSKT